jgi:hypothetical protein
MTKTIEVLDALPGCGKTHAIFEYMASDLSRPWLYLSPMKDEIDTRVDKESKKHNMEFYIPREGTDSTKTEQVLEFLKEGHNVACTHNLMHRFTRGHIAALRSHGYNVVCDETLDLLSGYNMVKDDWDFLKNHGLITVDENTGRLSFQDIEMGEKARYSDVKLLCDLGCLFSARRSDRMLVTQLSLDLMSVCNRFILISYNYKDSIMDVFLKLHGYDSCQLDLGSIKLWRDSEDVRKELGLLLKFIETPSTKLVQKKFSLSKSWWSTASKEHKDSVTKAMVSVKTKTKTHNSKIIFTTPKLAAYRLKPEGYQISFKNISQSSWIACNTRATNDYADRTLVLHSYNLFPNVSVKSYLQDQGLICNDDTYALNMLIQWVFRGCIRDHKPMNICVLSSRMNTIFKDWLLNVDL